MIFLLLVTLLNGKIYNFIVIKKAVLLTDILTPTGVDVHNAEVTNSIIVTSELLLT